MSVALAEERRPAFAGDAVAPVLLGALVAAMIAGRFETAVMALVVATAAAAVAGATWPGARALGMLATGSAIAIVLNLYLTPGRPIGLPRVWSLIPTVEGLAHGVLLALRLAGATAALRGLTAAWPGERAADELARLLAPLERFRVPVADARMVAGLARRFTPMLAGEASRIARLQDLRAGRPPRGTREWLARRRAVVVPALVAALERAEKVALVLEARHYRARPVPDRPAAGLGWRLAGWAIAGTALLWRR